MPDKLLAESFGRSMELSATNRPMEGEMFRSYGLHREAPAAGSFQKDGR